MKLQSENFLTYIIKFPLIHWFCANYLNKCFSIDDSASADDLLCNIALCTQP